MEKLGKIYTTAQLLELAGETDRKKRSYAALDIIFNLLTEAAESRQPTVALIKNHYHSVYTHPLFKFYMRARWSDFEPFLTNVPLLAKLKPSLLQKGSAWLNREIKELYEYLFNYLFAQ